MFWLVPPKMNLWIFSQTKCLYLRFTFTSPSHHLYITFTVEYMWCLSIGCLKPMWRPAGISLRYSYNSPTPFLRYSYDIEQSVNLFESQTLALKKILTIVTMTIVTAFSCKKSERPFLCVTHDVKLLEPLVFGSATLRVIGPCREKLTQLRIRQ